MNPLVWVLTRCMASDLACREDGTQLKSKESDSIERAKRIMIYVICVFVFFISVVVRESKLLWNDAVVMNVDDSKKYVYEEEAP